MLFLTGPRQVGKTTLARQIGTERADWLYLNWDVPEDRRTILTGADAVNELLELDRVHEVAPLLILDEVHKFKGWKNMLKGIFDAYEDRLRVMVTGSARMDVFKRGGDSLTGRYFPYRMHPLSVAELCFTDVLDGELRPAPAAVPDDWFAYLLDFGGFPEPYVRRSARFHTRWRRQRTEMIIREDLRDLSRTPELARISVLAQLIAERAGQLTSYTSLSNEMGVSIDTVKQWLGMLEALHILYPVRPWHKNVSRALRKEPKYYLRDWSTVSNKGSRLENFVACALLKAVDFWTDTGLGEYHLHFIRDKEKREVDFLVVKNGNPWFLVEVKSTGRQRLSRSLLRFHDMLAAPHAFQIAPDLPHLPIDCFSVNRPAVVPMQSFLSQLV